MNKARQKVWWIERAYLATLVLFGVLFSFPIAVHAGLTLKADEMCTPVIIACPCMQVPCKGGCCGGMNMHLCTCFDDPPTGHVSGICVAPFNCKGQTFTGQSGAAEAMNTLQQFLDALKKAGGGGGGAEATTPGLGEQCATYYQTTTPSIDPCANYVPPDYYMPPVSNSLPQQGEIDTSATRNLMEALGLPANTATFPFDTPGNSPAVPLPRVSSTSQPQSQASQAKGGTRQPEAAPQGGSISPKSEGDIVESEAGATIFARVRDTEQNVERTGFFGIGTLVGTAQSAAANICRLRPWDGSFISRLIPSSFFDGLCIWRGYQVGAPLPAEPIVTPVKKKNAPSSTEAISTGASALPEVKPKVDIWAVPDRVPLGTRTMIFWNTKGVESCTVASPDGSFEEHSLSGGAATIPLTGETTFTISCLTAAGTPVTDFVMVNLSM